MIDYKPNKFEFKMTSYDGTVQARTFSKEMLPDVLEEFEMFLKGCGFVFDGIVDIVSEDEPTLEPKEPIIHSHHYFDFNRNL
jgi:hypothetical protein